MTDMETPEFNTRDGVLQVRRNNSRWLCTGWGGGYQDSDTAYNVSVPKEWGFTDLHEYLRERLGSAGFEGIGPALFTSVELEHARGARLGNASVVVTAGLSNPVEAGGVGTVNVIAFINDRLSDGALASLLALIAETKSATLLDDTGFSGTTTDAVIVGCAKDYSMDAGIFGGSGTGVGSEVRSCVREAVRASINSRYPDGEIPKSVGEAEHGIVTNGNPEIFRI